MKVYLECTRTFQLRLNTGIQRVVRNIIRHGPAIGRQLGFECIPVVYDGGVWKQLPSPDVLSEQSTAAMKWKARFSQQRLKIYLRGVYDALRAAIYAIFPLPVVRRFLYAKDQEFGLNWIVKTPLRLYRSLRAHQGGGGAPGGGVDFEGPVRTEGFRFGPDDVFIAMDAFWQVDSPDRIWDIRDCGTRVVTVVYDLIPLTHPSYVPESSVLEFRRWVRALPCMVDLAVAISQQGMTEIQQYWGRGNPAPLIRQLDYFHLGCDLDQKLHDDVAVPNEIRALVGQSSTRGIYLCVGTVTHHKNQRYVLDAFDQVWGKRDDVILCFVGSIGWFTDGIPERIAEHPRHGKNLYLFSNLNDAGLDYLYRNAKALVTASKAEGFGLPIVEALIRKVPVFCSDIPVFHEIAGDFAGYFDLRDPSVLAEQVLAYENSGTLPARRSIEEFRWPTWEESTRSFFDRVFRRLSETESTTGRR